MDGHPRIEERLRRAIDAAGKDAPLTDDELLTIAKVIGDVVGCESYDLVRGPDVQCEIQMSIWDAMDLIIVLTDLANDDMDIASYIIDFADAFWQIPSAMVDRRFIVFSFDGAFYVFLRAPQGSRGAPLLWASVCALCSRLALATVPAQRMRRNTYEDDPEIIVLGTTKERRRFIC